MAPKKSNIGPVTFCELIKIAAHLSETHPRRRVQFQAPAFAAGSSMVKVVPSPNRLETDIAPPSWLMMP
jgi:hypothetical protein